MAEHELKTWSKYFAAVLSGDKPFELRRGDRPFAVGDTLRLREWDPDREDYTGREVRRVVSYVLRGEYWFGLLDDFVILGLESGERSSRQAWAAEAMRLQEAATADPWGCDKCMDADPEKPLCDACYRQFSFCSCVSDEQAAALAPVFTRPVCAVHPDGGGER